MKIRGISESIISDIVNKPEKMMNDLQGNIIAQKKIDEYLYRVIYRKENTNRIVITAYKTSKISKYES
jgi:hypothetical protein